MERRRLLATCRRALAGVVLVGVVCNTAMMAGGWFASVRNAPGLISPTADFGRRLAVLDSMAQVDDVLAFIYKGETGSADVTREYHQHLVEIAYAMVPRLVIRDPARRHAVAMFGHEEAAHAWAGEHGYRVLAYYEGLAYLERR